MTDNLPPLSALRAFEAAARHLSFTRAAEELGMTQAAVSYQIKLLEERIGTPLFLREPRKVSLSDAGQRLAPGLIQAFELMREAVASTRMQAQTTLTISTMQTFATNWLAYRIGAFQLAHPSIAVRLDTSPQLVDFNREQIDVGIRTGRGDWPGLVSHLLVESIFAPMMAPELAEKVKTPKDLLDLPLLDSDDPWWPLWFEAAGLEVDMTNRGPEMLANSQVLVGSMAMAGSGVAMLSPAFFPHELADGRLVQPFDTVCSRGIGYWLVYPHGRRNAPHIAAFRNWILGEIAKQSPGSDSAS